MNRSLIFLPLLLASCAGVLPNEQTAAQNKVASESNTTINKKVKVVPVLKVKDLPVLHDDPGIFKKYSATGDSVMNTTWTRKFDASGISLNNNRTCTLVTPQHVVMAAHYKRPVPSEVVFHDRNGKRVSRILVSVQNVHGDCAVGLLNQPLPANYKPYPLLTPDANYSEKLKDEFVIVTDQKRRLFVHQVRSITNGLLSMRFDESQQIGYGKILIKGDSGNPSFVMVNNEPVLVETHNYGGGGTGPFYGNADLQTKLRAAIESIGGSGMFKTVKWQ